MRKNGYRAETGSDSAAEEAVKPAAERVAEKKFLNLYQLVADATIVSYHSYHYSVFVCLFVIFISLLQNEQANLPSRQ